MPNWGKSNITKRNSWDKIIKEYDNNWYKISKHKHLPEQFIRYYLNDLHTRTILIYQKLPEDILEIITSYSNHDFSLALEYQNLSIDFIEEIFGRLDDFQTYIVLKYQKLNLTFIRKHLYQLDSDHMKYLIQYQKLSETFVMENIERFSIDDIEKILSRNIIKKSENIKFLQLHIL